MFWEYIRKRNYDIVVAMITSYASIDVAVRATTRWRKSILFPSHLLLRELKSSIEKHYKAAISEEETHKMQQEGKKIRYQFLSVFIHELKSATKRSWKVISG